MDQQMTVRAVVELLGRPKEHIEKTIRSYVDKIKNDEGFTVLREEFSDAKQQEGTELWATFVELEMKTTLNHLIRFCFEYMPSIIEILQPDKIIFTDEQLSTIINDLQACLHQVDMIAKQVKVENDIYKKNMTRLFRNYVTVLLSKNDLTSDQISQLTGVPTDLIEDYLDIMIDENRVKMEAGKYVLVRGKNNGSEKKD
jgi:hypothetical protein